MKKLLVEIGILMICAIHGTAQTHSVSLTLPSFAKFAVAPAGTAITVSRTTPVQGGDMLLPITDVSKWINYTSSVASGRTRSIMVRQLDALPSSVFLRIACGPCGTCLEGICGNGNTINISGTDQLLVSGIGGCYTGSGISNGRQLTFRLDISNWTTLTAFSSSNIRIQFTMIDN
jgi:hypothetical protein